jgi:tRNA-specific 2-thiouridylase
VTNVKGKHHIIVGVSGGVDSAVAAWLLQRQGHRVTAVFMKNWEEDDSEEHCAAAEDFDAARSVCERLDVPLRSVNFATEYWDQVFSEFLAEVEAGHTPNPDVLCNREIKFKAFLDFALSLGADRVATGHYARIEVDGGCYRLLKGLDANKDQSYFLYALNQHALAKSCFPLGELTKPQVRAFAREAGLPNHARKDSTGICFIGERPFKAFLRRYLPPRPGDIRTLTGEVKGRHEGLMYYTIGQRTGLGIGGPGGPWYAVDKDMRNNVLYVVEGRDHPALFGTELYARDLHWLAGVAPRMPLECAAKIRYRIADTACRLEAGLHDTIRVSFKQAQRAITPGQSVVFYDDDVCLGGGIIAVRAPAHVSTTAATRSVAH